MACTYDSYINNILETRGRFACGEEYHERHHIRPKCIGGTNDEENLIDLFAKEHFIAHKLLALENPNTSCLVQAYSAMAFMTNKDTCERYECSPEEYEEARKALSLAMTQLYSDPRNHPCYGKHASEETRKKQSEIAKKRLQDPTKNPMYGKRGKDNPNYGQHRSDEFCKKTSDRMKENNYMKGRFGAENPRAKKVVRLCDNKIYPCAKDAAEDNNINYSTFRGKCRMGVDFCYYDN